MVRSTKYLEIIEEENLVENAKKVGNYLGQKLEDLQSEYSDIFVNSRGRGLFRAIDFKDASRRDEFIKACYKNKMIILASGARSIRFRPALNISESQIDSGIDIIRQSIKELF